MAFFTKAEARARAARTTRKSVAPDSKRELRKSVTAATDQDTFDIFLSHASRDADLILGVKGLLESEGVTVYVDWVDDAQLDRSRVNRETADLLRRRMRQCRSFVWVATEAASSSKWMPWELGYFDGFRSNQVAILPLVDSAKETFAGQEYLALYPLISKGSYADTGGEDVFVEDGTRKWTTLGRFGVGSPIWCDFSA